MLNIAGGLARGEVGSASCSRSELKFPLSLKPSAWLTDYSRLPPTDWLAGWLTDDRLTENDKDTAKS